MTNSGKRGLSRRNLLKTTAVGAGALAVGPASRALGTELPTAPQGGGADGPLQLARVWFAPHEVALLGTFDDTHNVFDDGSIEVLLWPGDLARLQATGLRFEITVADLVARDLTLPTPGVVLSAAQPGETASGDYRHLGDYENDMRALAERFPDKARLIELPFTTFERRKVYALEIATDVHRRDGRAVFYNDGVHHAREWPAAEVPMMWAFDLLESYDSDPRIRSIVDGCRNIVVPVVNPDGFHYSREFPINQSNMGTAFGGQGQYVRKNRRTLFGPSIGAEAVLVGFTPPKPEPLADLDAYGIDPNRNYGFSWGGDGSSGYYYSQTYRGAQPFSEPESLNVAWLLKTNQVTALVTHHTSGDLVLWAWGDTFDDAPDNALLEGFGRAAAQYNGYRPQKSIQLYVTTGTTSDYAYGALGSIAYTFEHAGSSFHPPYGDTVPAMYAKNRDALILLCEEMCLAPEQRVSRDLPEDVQGELERFGVQLGGLHHSIVTGRLVDAAGNGVAGQVKLYKRFDTLLWRDADESNPLGQRTIEEIVETVHDTNEDGTFAIHVNPSTRPKLEFAGDTEAYELVARAGGRGSYRDVVARRGEIIDLGDVQVEDAASCDPPHGPRPCPRCGRS